MAGESFVVTLQAENNTPTHKVFSLRRDAVVFAEGAIDEGPYEWAKLWRVTGHDARQAVDIVRGGGGEMIQLLGAPASTKDAEVAFDNFLATPDGVDHLVREMLKRGNS